MAYRYLISCGCVRLINTSAWTDVIDQELLPASDLNIRGLIINGVDVYIFDETFLAKSNLLTYLNSTFVLVEDLDVIFRLEDGFLQFQPTDSIETVEIMAIYQNYMRVFQIGNPDPSDINVNITASFANGDPIIDDSLGDEVLAVKVGNLDVMPLDSTGYTHDSGATSLAFGADMNVENAYVFVLTKQVPA